MDQWVKFSLTGVVETAKSGISTFDNILQLQKQVDQDIQSLGRRAGTAQKVMQYLYKNPFITAEHVGKAAEVSMPAAYKLIESLEYLGVLVEVTGAERNGMYVFQDYLKLFIS